MGDPYPTLPFASRAGRSVPVTALGIDYGRREEIRPHRHEVCQLIYAIRGVMFVRTPAGQWIVPALRGVWIPAQVEHSIRMVGRVAMRTLYIQPEAARGLPTVCTVVAVSPLLRELILEAIRIRIPYGSDTRDGRLMRLALDEITQIQSLSFSLPSVSDPRLAVIENAIRKHPDEQTTASQWANRLGVNTKTIHRLFRRDTGLSFGRWRQQARLLRAVELLAQGERIIDIALEVGYRSPTAFSTMFRRQFGSTPSAFFSDRSMTMPYAGMPSVATAAASSRGDGKSSHDSVARTPALRALRRRAKSHR
jgi:AraC-like DNA-binding protein